MKGTPPQGCNRPWTCTAESPQLLWRSPGTRTYPARGDAAHAAGALWWSTVCVFTYLGLKVNIGGGHFCDLKDADSQRDGTQDKQTVVDQDPSQDCMSDPTVTADTEVWEGIIQVYWGILVQCNKTSRVKICFLYLGDSERIRAPCTNNAQVKFTTRKNILKLRKNNLRGILGREKRTAALRFADSFYICF